MQGSRRLLRHRRCCRLGYWGRMWWRAWIMSNVTMLITTATAGTILSDGWSNQTFQDFNFSWVSPLIFVSGSIWIVYLYGWDQNRAWKVSVQAWNISWMLLISISGLISLALAPDKVVVDWRHGLIYLALFYIITCVCGGITESPCCREFCPRCCIKGHLASYCSAQGCGRRRWRRYIQRSQIRWVKAGAFRRWNRLGEILPRCQILARDDFVVVGSSHSRIVISHAWLSEHHPDPTGSQLQLLVSELDRLNINDDELIFYDYVSLPQIDKMHPDFMRFHAMGKDLPHGHPAKRTIEQDRRFFTALKGMHLLFTGGFARVLVLPEVPATADNNRQYIDRGWCFFELSISADHGRITNIDREEVNDLLEREDCRMPLTSARFRHAFQSKQFTNRGDDKLVKNLYNSVARSRQCSLLATCLVVCAIGAFYIVAFHASEGVFAFDRVFSPQHTFWQCFFYAVAQCAMFTCMGMLPFAIMGIVNPFVLAPYD